MVTSPVLYAGKHINEVLKPAIYSGSSVEAGLWKVISTMLSKAVYTTLNFADTLNVGDFCGTGAASTSTLSEVAITLTQWKADFTVCKANFRGTYLEDNINPALEAYVSNSILAYGKILESVRWSGSTALAAGVAPLNLQNGVIAQLITGASFIPVVGASAAAITAPATVIAELNKALAVVPNDVLQSKEFRIIMAPSVYRAYQQAAFTDGNFNAGLYLFLQGAATTANVNSGAVGSFYGYPIYVTNGLDVVTTLPSTKANAHVVLMGTFQNDNSNLILATDLIGDLASLNVIDLAPTGNDSFRIQFMFKQGIGVVNQNQIVMYR